MKRKAGWALVGAALSLGACFGAGYVVAQQRAEPEVRRVVTKLDDAGKAVVLFDDRVVLSGERAPNFVANLWVTDKSLPEFSSGADWGKKKTGIAPPKNGSVFRIVEFAPEPARVAYLDKNTMMKAVGDDAPKKGLPPRHPMMHRTRTLDYAIVLAGEIDMLLDDSEVHLKAGDVIVQQATNHAWVNRGNAPCRVAFVLMDSQEP